MHIVIFITCGGKKEAQTIAQALLREKLVACVNIIKGVSSHFWWESKIDSAKETLLIAKSQKSKFRRIIKLTKSRHSYQVPEIIALPIVGGEKKYLSWIDDAVR
jgi:periplasmic divalent cation tolerance protein